MSDQGFAPLIADVKGTSLSDDDKRLLSMPTVGGVILFSRNYENIEQLQNLTQAIAEFRPELLICVDQEGGRVQRFKTPFTHLPPLRELGLLAKKDAQHGLNAAFSHGWLMASELISIGVDLSFAPVLDLDKYDSEVIGNRSFCSEHELVTVLAEAYINGMHEAGMCATGKHFPGHGSVKTDSHLALPIDSRELAEVMADDMQPFEYLISKLDAIMPAHICFEKVDNDPVGFSRDWLQGVLRSQLNFKGLIFSDDLSMGAAATAGDYCQRAKKALDAGCDAILVCNQPMEAMKVAKFLMESEDFRIPENSLSRLKQKPDGWSQGLNKLRQTSVWQQHHKVLEQCVNRANNK